MKRDSLLLFGLLVSSLELPPGGPVLAASPSLDRGLDASARPPSSRPRTFHRATGRVADETCFAAEDSLWWDGFALPILDGSIDAATVDEGGDLIVAGSFTQAALAHAEHVARWTGSAWSALPANLPKWCRALTWWNGRLVAGCEGETPGPETLVYALDGSTWTPLGSMSTTLYTNAGVRALVVYGGDLIAAGSFDIADGENVGCVARWDGTRWTPLGAGFPGGDGRALAVHATKLVVGGALSGFDGVAQWDGTAWSGLAAGLRNASHSGTVWSLQVLGTMLYASGPFDRSGAAVFTGLAQWDGVSWSSLGTSMPAGQSQVLAVHQDELIASNAGNKVARWNGTQWVSLADGSLSEPRVLLSWGGRLVMSSPSSGLVDFDGASWSPIEQGWSPGTMAGLAGYLFDGVEWRGKLVVANAGSMGSQDHLEPSSSVGAWDGTAWTSVGPAVAGSAPYALTVWNDLVVAGFVGTTIGGVPAKHIAAWDGTT